LEDEPLRAIQRSREVQPNRAEKLGLIPNLINLVPVTIDRVSLSLEFVLDKENRTDEDKRMQEWKACMEHLTQAQVLLLDSPTYLYVEANEIITSAFQYCKSRIFAERQAKTWWFSGESQLFSRYRK
jgi:hypothetical protein